MLDHQKFSLHEQSNLFAVIGAGSLVGLMLFSLSLFRRLSFELFLRTHQALAAVCIYMTWRHLPSVSIFPRVYIYIPLAILLLSTFLHVLLFLYRNGILPPRTYPYASVMCRKKCENTQGSDEDPAEDTPLKIRMALPRPMHVKAGQYVNLWMPSVSFSSWLQCHPFMVTSWSPGRQDVLDLFVRTRHGLTEKLRARAAREGTASFTAFVSGPYGRSESVGEYESVLAVASGFGIAGVVPYIKRLLYGYNTSSVRVRRVHLVWQVQTMVSWMTMSLMTAMYVNLLWLGWLTTNWAQILEMSFYAEYKTKAGKARPFGVHHRATIYNGFPDYDSIISTEATGEHIERVSNSREERGKLLVLISAKDELQDHLTVIVRKYLDQRVKFHKVEFQPS
ncbi:cell surface metalloreductase, putative [Aspergillus fumigatus A1163]|uniref:ferric-chelate reductase (NADPH) n=1 Tax=Aspergillus fumigatus (strain CBS 144.89 / FGSC A1163 / CEA10) TaxID=451804 RepID=B0Y7X6_ASPFC|nr:cell surface metalloreductase, putative [Aspergillus fumigatus A1163]